MKKRMSFLMVLVAALIVALTAAPAFAGTVVPGHDPNKHPDRIDADGNGFPDEGVTVNGHYTLEQSGCSYVVNYRGNFENDPYLDSGYIYNNVRCPEGPYNYLIVHETDPRYRGNPDWSIWETWEFHTLTVPGVGNLVRPYTHVGS